MRSKISASLRVGLLAVLAALLLLPGCVILPRRAFPKTSGSPQVEGLNNPVEVIRDRYGVPHIYGTTPEDMYFAQGYVHAQDRFWQMEFSRRVGSGRLSELFGKNLLETDIFLRTLGFRKVADQEYDAMNAQARKLLDAYVAGVNAYIKDKKPGTLGLEYSFLKLQGTDFEVEEWEPQDSLTWAKMMAWDLANNMSFERTVLSILRTAGYTGTQDYYAPYRPDMPVIVSDEEMGGSSSSQTKPIDEDPEIALARLFLGRETGEGSNCWVVSGDLTESGKPILANDTHLSYGMPSIFYEFAMHQVNEDGSPNESDGTFHARGFSFPGYPGLIIGHTNYLAWGITDFGDDVQDLFLERINPANPNQYEVDGEWVDMELSFERFDIQGEREPFIQIVRKTHHGPIISDRGGYKVLEGLGYNMEGLFPGNLELHSVSLQWTALEPGTLVEAQVEMCLAKSFAEFRTALEKWNGPVQNITYADIDGNIGYQTAGWIPIRGKGDGRIPAPGWLSEFDWTGYIPFDELPVSYNPQKGFIVTANNKATSDNYPHLLGTNFAYGYRAKRITELIIADQGGINVEDIKVMQADTFDIAGTEILAYLTDLDLSYEENSAFTEERVPGKEKTAKKRKEMDTKVEERMEQGREILVNWDGYFDRDSAGAALYGFFLVALAEEVYKDQYPYERWERISGRQMQNSLYYLLEEPANPWWDNVKTPDIIETRDGILVRSLRRALRYGIEELGDDIEKWEWGSLHKTEFVNASLGKSGIGFIEKIFNRGPISSPGSMTTVNVGSWYFAEPFDTYHGVASREIIDMGDLNNSFMIHPTGQSGHPRHKHYDDYIEQWRDVEYHPTLWIREDVLANKKGTLTLQPE